MPALCCAHNLLCKFRQLSRAGLFAKTQQARIVTGKAAKICRTPKREARIARARVLECAGRFTAFSKQRCARRARADNLACVQSPRESSPALRRSRVTLQ